ncbi:hypothetical protein [Gymnodinialimonas sp. 57CJ19]|uniref:hypothetical protein n=1 Tax=Gymnodinialimonas sp. 57CJ19 TaxID=3138498 RepID=UPI003134639F
MHRFKGAQTSEMSGAMIFKLNDPAFLSDPTKQLAQLRSERPLVRVITPLLGTICKTTTDEAARRRPDWQH